MSPSKYLRRTLKPLSNQCFLFGLMLVLAWYLLLFLISLKFGLICSSMAQRDKTYLSKIFLLVVGWGMAESVWADTGKIIPGEFVLLMFLGILIGAFAGAGILTLFTKILLELFKRRQPKTYAWMIIGAALLPLIYIWLEDSQNLLYDFEGTYGYERKEQLHYILIGLVSILGQVLGYVVIPKRGK